jgi:hypothetical protein
MTAWPAVPWSSADQIIAVMSDDPPPLAASVEPALFCRDLVAQNRLPDAVEFIAHALPRYECVMWAARTMLDSGTVDRSGALMSAILRWIDDPQDSGRRAVRTLSDTVRDTRPEYLLGMAVFFSGGSISEPDLPPVLPQPDITAKLAGGAVLKAASLGAFKATMMRAVELGEAIAATPRGR